MFIHMKSYYQVLAKILTIQKIELILHIFFYQWLDKEDIMEEPKKIDEDDR